MSMPSAAVLIIEGALHDHREDAEEAFLSKVLYHVKEDGMSAGSAIAATIEFLRGKAEQDGKLGPLFDTVMKQMVDSTNDFIHDARDFVETLDANEAREAAQALAETDAAVQGGLSEEAKEAAH